MKFSVSALLLLAGAALAQTNPLIPPPSPLSQFRPTAPAAPQQPAGMAVPAAPAAAAAASTSATTAAAAASSVAQDSTRPFNPQLEAGLKALERKHYATALRSFTALANAGEPRAQNNMGIMYERGWGVVQSYVEAMNWYRKSAGQGLPEAEFNVGSLYHNGYGVEVNNSQAVFWFKKAAAQNLPDGLYMMGVHTWEGKGIRRDPVAAKDYSLRAARVGHVASQFMAAYLFMSEEAGKPDLVAAHVWALVAEANGFGPVNDIIDFTTFRLKQPQIDMALALTQRCIKSQYKDCPR